MPELEGTALFAVAAAIAASVLAVGLAVRVAAEGRRTGSLRAQIDELLKDNRGTRKQREQRDKTLRQAESDRDRATRKLAQADKRGAQSRADARQEREEGEERGQALAADLEAARAEVDRLQTALSRTQAELGAATQHVASAEARASAAERAAAQEPPPRDAAEITALNDRVSSAENDARERKAGLAKAADQVVRLKARLETQDQLYASIRSELGAKKDHIRQQREELERLRAYKVALVDSSADATDSEPAD
jgi:chromosome segregation ATPase